MYNSRFGEELGKLLKLETNGEAGVQHHLTTSLFLVRLQALIVVRPTVVSHDDDNGAREKICLCAVPELHPIVP